MEHVNGLDVSDFQGEVNWPAVKAAGFSFAVAKATQGAHFTADTFAKNIGGIRAAGMIAGAYHFMEWNVDPAAQASHFLSTYQHEAGDLVPMLDLEYPDANARDIGCSASEAVDRIARFLRAVEDKLGERCLVYVAWGFWQDALASTDGFAGHPLWLAQYTDAPEPTVELGAWKPRIWQYSESGQVDGIDGSVDLDRYLGTLDELRTLTLK